VPRSPGPTARPASRPPRGHVVLHAVAVAGSETTARLLGWAPYSSPAIPSSGPSWSPIARSSRTRSRSCCGTRRHRHPGSLRHPRRRVARRHRSPPFPARVAHRQRRPRRARVRRPDRFDVERRFARHVSSATASTSASAPAWPAWSPGSARRDAAPFPEWHVDEAKVEMVRTPRCAPRHVPSACSPESLGHERTTATAANREDGCVPARTTSSPRPAETFPARSLHDFYRFPISIV